MRVCPNAQLPTPPAGPLYIFFKPTALKNHPSSLFIPFFHQTRTMSADSFFKIPSYDSSSDKDEVQQHSSSEEASREYMDPNLIPNRSSDTEEEDENNEPEDDDIDE